MAGTVSETARELKDIIEEKGSWSKDEVMAWVREQDLPPNQYGLVLGQGAGKSNKWWHTIDGVLYSGPKPGEENGSSSLPPKDPHSLEVPHDQFVEVAKNLGIPEKAAKAAAFYIDTNFDLMNPDKVADALRQITEIQPAQKARLLITWTSFTKGEIPEALRERAKALASDDLQTATENAKANGHVRGKRFVASNGEVLVTQEDDPGGMSLGEAIQVANLQFQSKPQRDDGNSTWGIVVQEMGANQRETLKALAEANRPSDNGKSDNSMDLVFKLFDARMETERVRNDGMVERLATSQENMVGKLTEMMGQIAGMVTNKRSPFAELDEFLPGLSKRLMDGLFAPPQAATQGLTVKLPGLAGGGAAEAEVTLEAYQTIKELEQKDQMLQWGRETLPKLFQFGERLAKSIDRAAETEGKAEPTAEVPGKGQTNCANPECNMPVMFSLAAQAFQCPNCLTVQSPDGTVYDQNLIRQERQSPEEPPPDAESEPTTEGEGERDEADAPATVVEQQPDREEVPV